MFTGIIENLGTVKSISGTDAGRHLEVEVGSLAGELDLGDSLAVNGVCLTVVKKSGDTVGVDVVLETLRRTSLGALLAGDRVNLEMPLSASGRFDGHIVQGHVDQTAILRTLKNANGSWLFTFEYDPAAGNVTVEKGSIAVNGVSLTCFDSKVSEFTVAIIPYTYENTNFNQLKIGNVVNLEFDVIGKYVKRLLQS